MNTEDIIINFTATLTGAFLGITIPYILQQKKEKNNYKKFVNYIFAKASIYQKSLLTILQLEKQGIINDNHGKDIYKTIEANVQDYTNFSDLLPDIYHKYIKPDLQISLLQNELNIQVLHRRIESTNISNRKELIYSINPLLECASRRMWILYLLTRGHCKDTCVVEFNEDSFNKLIAIYNESKTKDLFSIKIKKTHEDGTTLFNT